MMRFSTTAPAELVIELGAASVEREHGLTRFEIKEREAAAFLRELAGRSWPVKAGWPRGLAVKPQGYAIASAHIRRG
jgi:hypothetical protein